VDAVDAVVPSHAESVRVVESFDDFYRRERRGLVALAYALTGNADVADDLAHEALTAAGRRWDQVGAMELPIGWVRRVVANRSTSFVRRRIVEAKALPRLVARAERHTVPAMPSDSEHVWSAIRRLPRRQAQVITLKALFRLSLQEIADELGISKESAQTHLARARTALIAVLDQEDAR
jgi:RNA polymerase sigma factor (sigma-70 family)